MGTGVAVTPLALVKKWQPAVVSLLVGHGRYGLTALHYSVRGGKRPFIELLLERGAPSRTRWTKTG